MKTTEKARENRLRRWAARLGLALRKGRARAWSIHDRGGYALIDAGGGYDVAGADFELDLDAVERTLRDYEERAKRRP